MTCYHPKYRIENIGKWEKAADGHLYHPAIIVPADSIGERLEDYKKHNWNYKKTIIPCRKCIGCRLDYSRDWANRGYIESLKSKNNYFITLTYNDENLPMIEEITTSKGVTYTNDGTWCGVLKPDHFTGFVHDIRQHYRRKSGKTGIKYIGCGEYGTQNLRPHYHLIMFDVPFEPEDMYGTKIIDGNYYSQNKIVEKYWKRGFSYVSTANWDTIAYVSRYITKKLYGDNAEDSRAQKGQIAEFIRVSKGIGKDYWEENKEKILETDSIVVHNHKGTFITKPPKYYTRLLKKENPALYESIKEKRETENDNMQKVKDTTHTYGRLGELENEERTKLPKAGTLKRDL